MNENKSCHQQNKNIMDKTYYDKIKTGLESNYAKKIISAVKLLQKEYVSGFEEIIVHILENRYRTNKSWEVQSELIKLLGKECIMSALPIIKEIVTKNVEFDMVTIQAAMAYLRMTRENISDVSPIISMFGKIGYSVGEGFLSCLGEDLMIPSVDNQNKLISYFWDFGNPTPLGHIDPRFGLAQAAQKWKTPEAEKFIEHCSLSLDSKLSNFAMKIIQKHK